MKAFLAITKRNIKMFFKDKGMFFMSLITPIILLVLYITFLANVYRDSFHSSMPDGFQISDKLVNGTVGAELFSSLLAVSCVTIAFCSNLLMVQDKVNGVRKDFLISPIKRSTLAASYFVGSLLTTLIVSYCAAAACFIYIAINGWYMSFADVCLTVLDMLILVTFGTALSSVVSTFLTTQGQMSAVGTVVSAGYGFICGAYMPISQFGEGLRNVLGFLPGTYGTSLIKNHALSGVFGEMERQGFPEEVVRNIKGNVDCTVKFFGTEVSEGAAYVVFVCSVLLIIGVYVLINVLRKKRV